VHEKNKGAKSTGDLSAQMLIIKDFIDEFYNKTVFHGGKALNSDLTPSQIKSLFAFEKDDHEYPIGELGKNARVKSSTMTDMIDRLEKDGIAERIRDDGDRRVVKVRLTDKGKKIKRQFSVKMRTGIEEAFSHLSEGEKRILINHLKGAFQILKRIE
jgi:DNA-binding MarR family transcriptional regulator